MNSDSSSDFSAALIDDRLKGIPGGVAAFPIGQAGSRNWNLLREDLPLPVAILKASAIDHNSNWMRRFLALSGAVLAPHGKTTMSPQLFKRQFDDGAWALTLANISQVQVARRFAVQRILLANQLVGKQAVRYIFDQLQSDPGFEFLCLVDSLEGVRYLAAAARERAVGRPLQVLLEGGVNGARSGCRTLDEALAVAHAVKQAEPFLCLRGVEGFEGVIDLPDSAETETRVADFLKFLVEIAHRCDELRLFADDAIILSAGGSAYYDLVADYFAAAELSRESMLVLRCGCYLVHDSILYRRLFERLLQRSAQARDLGAGLKPALQVWAYVQSRPEIKRVIIGLGKRDCSFDAGLPKPLGWFRPGLHDAPQALSEDYRTVALNDQHGFLDVPDNSPLQVGDMIACGIAHPCLTFDKWQIMPLVDDAYNVTSLIRTYF